MIITLGIYLISFLLNVVNLLLAGISVAIPTQLQNSFSYVFGYLSLLRGIFPVETLVYCLSIFFYAVIAIYGFKILTWLLTLIPFINLSKPPSIHETRNYYQIEGTGNRIFFDKIRRKKVKSLQSTIRE